MDTLKPPKDLPLAFFKNLTHYPFMSYIDVRLVQPSPYQLFENTLEGAMYTLQIYQAFFLFTPEVLT